MRKFGNAAWLMAVAGLWLAPRMQAQTNTNVVVAAFSSTSTTPLHPGFAGFACEMPDTGLEYDTTNFQQFVTSLSPGWIRYPSGISDDAFDWSTGLADTNWITTIPAPTLSGTATNPAFTLQWVGLSNVMYSLPTSTNLATWATLGKLTNAGTNFSFTDYNTEKLRFYRLLVP